MNLIFATNNANKIKEIQNALGEHYNIIGLKDAGINIDIPEPYFTFQENAWTKANTIHQLSGMDCFSEDTGLEIPALNNEPGVKSARYAGNHASDKDNIQKVLTALQGKTPTPAHFRTVICLIHHGQPYYFEGICEGTIIANPTGDKGFGYDPIFIPNGATNTFACMTTEEKNLYSHRKKAVKKMIDFLKENHAR